MQMNYWANASEKARMVLNCEFLNNVGLDLINYVDEYT